MKNIPNDEYERQRARIFVGFFRTATAGAIIEGYDVTSGRPALENSARTGRLQVPKTTAAGVITDRDGRETLSGVAVIAADQYGGAAASAVSNASGEYALKLPVGTFAITAEKSGYQKKTLEPISAQTKEKLTQNILEVPAETYTLKVTAEGYAPIRRL